jgi:predicted unusual protein kinase regulating ubiquinone biosynthesis (AarF/ABC1/UbiB family)
MNQLFFSPLFVTGFSGKLAILDFGLMTEISDDQKYGMIVSLILRRNAVGGRDPVG